MNFTTQLTELGRTVNAAMVEVRSEIAEIKCEIKAEAEDLQSAITPIQAIAINMVAKEFFYRNPPSFPDQVTNLVNKLAEIKSEQDTEKTEQWQAISDESQAAQTALLISLSQSIIEAQTKLIEAMG